MLDLTRMTEGAIPREFIYLIKYGGRLIGSTVRAKKMNSPSWIKRSINIMQADPLGRKMMTNYAKMFVYFANYMCPGSTNENMFITAKLS